MTVLTKINDKPHDKLITDETKQMGHVTVPMAKDLESDFEPRYEPKEKKFCFSTSCLLGLLVCIIIIGFIFMTRIYSQKYPNRFNGWCSVPYQKESLHFKNPVIDEYFTDSWTEQRDPWFSDGNPMFREEFELDLNQGNFMKISVPDFGYGHSAEFVHDFVMNKTGAITENRCYVMPLDRHYAVLPKEMFEIIRKVWNGAHDLETGVVYKKMKVLKPAIVDVSGQGTIIANLCVNRPTFMVQEFETTRIRRDANTNGQVKFAEFAGNSIVELTIEE